MGCKVDSLVDRHDLTVPNSGYDSIHDYLVARWTGSDGRSSEGYKSLTDWFNTRLLARRYESRGRDAVSVHVDREYEVITGDDTIERDELAADLATDGLDIEDLDDELISWSTMRHHLKGCLDAEKETRSAATDWETNTVQKAREQTAKKARSVLSSLTSKGRLPDADRAEVDVQVKLSCPECSVRVPFEDAVERGYVCETHFEDASDDPVKERVTNSLSSVALPLSLVEVIQVACFDEPLLLDVLALPFV